MYYREAVQKNERYWNELIYWACEGDPARMTALRRFDAFDFFMFIQNYEKKIEQIKKKK